MRSPCPNSPTADRARQVAAALVAAAVVLIAGCAADASIESAADLSSAAGGPVATAPDRVRLGPQGGEGQFVVECEFDRFLADDPIVFPRQAGASHLHQFFGAVGVSVESTQADLLAGDTTCDQQADTASYWSPALVGADGEIVEPLGSVAYYRAGPDVEPADVVAFPPGLMMVAGDHTAIEPQPLSIVAWSCSTGAQHDVRPIDCEDAKTMRLSVTFHDCWNGVDVRSPIPAQPSIHVAYSTAGECPATHPVHIPQLEFAIEFPPQPAGDLDRLALTSGDILSGHADFWNAWDQTKLDNEVALCIHRELPCGLGG